jgi:hypothetical protein
VPINVAHAKEIRQLRETRLKKSLVQVHVSFDGAYARDELGGFGRRVRIVEHIGDWNA